MGEIKKTRQALYRTHRPKSLDEVVGQEHVTQTLANALKQERVSHAYLFTGPRGVGKTSIARILAHQINNLPYEDDRPHLDIIEIDAASNRRIDDIRDLREKVNIAPVSAKYKVYIIDEVHMLTTESFNALLKTLEEPPEHVVFILATTEFHKLPATIVSRTQRHSFHSLPAAEMANYLRKIAEIEKIEIDDQALELIAQHGEGSFRDSISILDQLSGGHEKITREIVELLLGVAPKEQLAKLIKSMDDGNTSTILATVDALILQGLTPSGIASQLLSTFRAESSRGVSNRSRIALMRDLIGINNSPFAKLSLEAALLDYSLQQNPALQIQERATEAATSKQKSKTQSPEPLDQKPKPQEEPAEPAKPAKPEVSTKPADKPHDAEAPKVATKTKANLETEIDKHWPSILKSVKSANNSLYTILRLADPSIENNALKLAFRFPFHQKRADDSKNKAILAKILDEDYGQALEITAVVDESVINEPAEVTIEKMDNISSMPSETKDPAPDIQPPAPDSDSSQASLITNIQDIMGGGEVING